MRAQPSPRVIAEPLEGRTLMAVVVVFYDGRYVDTSTTDGTPASATNLMNTIQSLGHTIRQ